MHDNMHSVRIIEEDSICSLPFQLDTGALDPFFDHSSFCNAWQRISLATSIHQPADPQRLRIQWAAHVYTKTCQTNPAQSDFGQWRQISRSGSHVAHGRGQLPVGSVIEAAPIILQITRCNYCSTFEVWQPHNYLLKIIRQLYKLQVACNDVGSVSLSRRSACMSSAKAMAR